MYSYTKLESILNIVWREEIAVRDLSRIRVASVQSFSSQQSHPTERPITRSLVDCRSVINATVKLRRRRGGGKQQHIIHDDNFGSIVHGASPNSLASSGHCSGLLFYRSNHPLLTVSHQQREVCLYAKQAKA